MDDGRNGAERFVEVVEKLQTKYDSATERGVVGARVFGEEGVRQVNGLIVLSGDLGTAMSEVSTAHIFSEADLRRAADFKRETSDVWQNLLGIRNDIGERFMPTITWGARGANALLNEPPGLEEAIAARDGEPTKWVRDLADRIVAAAQAASPTTINNYSIAPTPAGLDQALRDYAFANGSRAK